MNKLKIYQIYYNAETESNCMPETEKFFNTNCTQFFENKIISDLVAVGEHKKAEYFGVFSHKFTKRHRFANYAGIEKTLDKFAPDCLSFFAGRGRLQNPIPRSPQTKLFREILQECLNGAGINFDINDNCKFYIMFNHFVMKSELYEKYVKEYLNPFMIACSQNEKANENRKYSLASRRFSQNPDLVNQLGDKFYKYHAFLCEMLPSIFCTMEKIKAIHL
jgi:hypothetical protein